MPQGNDTSELPGTEELPTVPQRIGQYRVERLLGQRGFPAGCSPNLASSQRPNRRLLTGGSKGGDAPPTDTCKGLGATTAVCFTGALNAVGATDSGVRHRRAQRSVKSSVDRADWSDTGNVECPVGKVSNTSRPKAVLIPVFPEIRMKSLPFYNALQ